MLPSKPPAASPQHQRKAVQHEWFFSRVVYFCGFNFSWRQHRNSSRNTRKPIMHRRTRGGPTMIKTIILIASATILAILVNAVFLMIVFAGYQLAKLIL
jgi:hypothetical protein